MKYQISKLARKISKELELSSTQVWDILEELNYEAQELNDRQVQQWICKVSKKVFYK